MSIRIQAYRNSAAIFALGAMALQATPAFADKAGLNSMSFDAKDASGVIRVVSTGKAAWDQIEAGTIQFNARMKINTKYPGYVDDMAVLLGECDGGFCAGVLPVLWSDSIVERDYDSTEAVALPTQKIGVSGTGITLGDQIISRCNAKLQPDGPTKSHGFSHDLPVAFIADTGETWGNIDKQPDEAQLGSWPHRPNETDHVRTDTLSVQVICDPVVKSPTNDVKIDFGDFDVESVKLFLTTYQNNQPGSNPGTVCPALKVTSRAKANQASPVTMRIWRQKDNGPITSEVKQAWASFDAAKNGYFATYQKWEDVGTTSYFQYRTEIVEDSVFPPFDGWKDITVHCTSPGGGGLAPLPQNDPDQPQPHAEWEGELTIADSAGADKSCPRKGQVFFAATRPEPGDFNYRISCSNGAFFTGTATAYDQGSGIFEAYGAHDISVSRTRSIQCTLQELQPAPVTVATDRQDFTCNNPAIDPDADDLTVDSRPDPVEPTRPLVVVDPAPKCGPNQKPVRGRCVRNPMSVAACGEHEQRVNGKCVRLPGVSIRCLPGFEQVGRKCVRKPQLGILCKAGFKLVGKTCVRKPDVSILCKPGFKLEGKTCVRKPVVSTACADGEKLVRGKCAKTRPATAKVKRFADPAPELDRKAAKAIGQQPARKKLGGARN